MSPITPQEIIVPVGETVPNTGPIYAVKITNPSPFAVLTLDGVKLSADGVQAFNAPNGQFWSDVKLDNSNADAIQVPLKVLIQKSAGAPFDSYASLPISRTELMAFVQQDAETSGYSPVAVNAGGVLRTSRAGPATLAFATADTIGYADGTRTLGPFDTGEYPALMLEVAGGLTGGTTPTLQVFLKVLHRNTGALLERIPCGALNNFASSAVAGFIYVGEGAGFDAETDYSDRRAYRPTKVEVEVVITGAPSGGTYQVQLYGMG